jgi:hypothetical protein
MAANKVKFGTVLTLFVGVGMLTLPVAAAGSTAACEIGAYRSADGDAVVLTQRGDKYRYTFIDGRYGYVSDPGAHVSCASKAVTVAGADGEPEVWPKAPLRVRNTSFESNGAKLGGQLIEPVDQGKKAPLVVMVHGSERTGWIGRVPYPWIAAAQGVSAFIFDKRGTGTSEGEYTQNFTRLAEDVVAASAEARRLAAGRFSRMGLFGGSQGGWIAPLAAKKAGAEFLVVGFGLILSPLEEDAEQVFAELKSKGYGPDALEKARAVTDATGAVMACHFECGFEQLAAVKQAYGKEPWFREIRGEFTGDLLEANEEELRATGRAEFDNLDIEWPFDSMPVLRDLSMPQLWVLAGKDREAPGELTEQRLDALRREGKPIEVVLFPDADHGITEFVTLPDGTRDITRIAEGYFRLLADWMKGTRAPPYGNSRKVYRNAPVASPQ